MQSPRPEVNAHLSIRPCAVSVRRHAADKAGRPRRIHEGGMSHAAKPAPASRPNAKTATPVITRPGVRDAKVLCVARRGSVMGTHQAPTPAQRKARFVPCDASSSPARNAWITPDRGIVIDGEAFPHHGS